MSSAEEINLPGRRNKMNRINARNVEETYFKGQHLSLPYLKQEDINNRYLWNNIPAYPESVEFHGKKLSHVTGRQGLEGIFQDMGFRQTSDTSHFLWWQLSITNDDIRSAEQQFLASLFPDTQIDNQLPFLEYFTTSKAFQNSSPYGNFCFTFSIRELLRHYGAQFCAKGLVLRVYETVLYSQEIQYTIVVHPRNVNCYDHLPRLPGVGDGVCGYSNGAISWCCQAPSETYRHRFNVNRRDRSINVSPHNERYFVWDHVCVAFHMEPGWVLHVDQDELFNSLNVCEVSKPCLLKPPETPLSLHEADSFLTNLKDKMGCAGVRD